MHIDFSNILRKNLPNKIDQPRRSQIYLGFKCSQKCGFCYYKSKCQQPMFDFQIVKNQIDAKLKYGIQDFELTGGEPAESKILRKTCEYIKFISPHSKIAIITNGSLFQCNVFDIIDEVLVSYHIDKNSQKNTFFPFGNTWKKVNLTIQKAKEHNLLIRTNTVLGTFNLNSLDNILNDIIQLQPKIINFLPINLFDEANNLAKFIDYDLLRIKLKQAFKRIDNELPNTLTFARYMPFCQMNGFEDRILGYLQHIYDWFDWNVELGATELLDDLNIHGINAIDSLGQYGSTSISAALNNRNIFYTKTTKCLKCKFNIICDGIEKSISKKDIDKFIQPISGLLIKDPFSGIAFKTKNLYDSIFEADHH